MVQIKDLSLAAALLLAAPVHSLYSKSSPVLQLDQKSFEKEILQTEHAAIVEFYAPWCGHCKNLAPQYKKAAENLRGIAKVAAVDCDEEKNKPLCGQMGVKGFPTLKLVKPSSKKGKPIIKEYQGPRTAKGIVDAVVDEIPNHVQRLTAPKLTEWLNEKNETSKAILFTPKGTTSALYKALAIDFLGSMEFAQVRDKETDALKQFGIEKVPSLVILPGGSAPGKVYEGAMKHEALHKFLAEIAPPKAKSKEEPKAKKEKKGKVEEIVEEIKEKIIPETPKIPLIIPDLVDTPAVTNACFSPTSKKTCIIALVAPSGEDPDPTLAGLHAAHEKAPKTYRFYKVSVASQPAMQMVKELKLSNELPSFVAINGAKRWFIPHKGDTSAGSILAWLDGMKFGESKKEKLPKGFFEAVEEIKEEVKEEPVKEKEVKAEEEPVAVEEEKKGHDEL